MLHLKNNDFSRKISNNLMVKSERFNSQIDLRYSILKIVIKASF